MTVEEMKAVDIRTVSREELVDIRDVVIDQEAPKEERIKSFLRQIKNPYCFKVGNVVVKTTFADTDMTLDDRLEHYFCCRKGIVSQNRQKTCSRCFILVGYLVG